VIVVELDVGVRAEIERDVGAARLTAFAVVLVPAVVQRRLVFPRTRGEGEGFLPDVVIGVGGEFSGGAFGLPVAGTAEFVLQAADNGDRGGVGRVVRQQRRRKGNQGKCAKGTRFRIMVRFLEYGLNVVLRSSIGVVAQTLILPHRPRVTMTWGSNEIEIRSRCGRGDIVVGAAFLWERL
jgi:hypothetical protein